MVVRERVSGPTVLHGRLLSRMAYLLESWIERRSERDIMAVNSGWVLAVDPGTVRIPDLAFVTRAWFPDEGTGYRHWVLGPDLAVEITSPANSWTEIQERVSAFLGAGSRMVWIVDPPPGTVTIYRPDAQARRVGEDGELDGGDVLPGLRIRLADYFEI